MCMGRTTEPVVINPDRYYTCWEIAKLGLIPNIKTPRQALDLAKTDKVTNNYLDAVRVPRGEKGWQYQIRGSGIITYLVNNE